MTAHLTLATAAAQVSAYVLPCNIHRSPVNTSFYYFRSAGAGTGTEVSANVEFTIDPPGSSTALWFTAKDGSANLVGVSAITLPHQAIRLNVTQVSGSVNISFAALNAGM